MADTELSTTFVRIRADASEIRSTFASIRSEGEATARSIQRSFAGAGSAGGGAGGGISNPFHGINDGAKQAAVNVRHMSHELRGMSEVMRGVTGGNTMEVLRGMFGIAKGGGIATMLTGMGGLMAGAVGFAMLASQVGEWREKEYAREKAEKFKFNEEQIKQNYDIKSTPVEKRVANYREARTLWETTVKDSLGYRTWETPILKKLQPKELQGVMPGQKLKGDIQVDGETIKAGETLKGSAYSKYLEESLFKQEQEDYSFKSSREFTKSFMPSMSTSQQKATKAGEYKEDMESEFDNLRAMVDANGKRVVSNDKLNIMQSAVDKTADIMGRPESRAGTVTTGMGYWEMMQGAVLKPEVKLSQEQLTVQKEIRDAIRAQRDGKAAPILVRVVP